MCACVHRFKRTVSHGLCAFHFLHDRISTEDSSGATVVKVKKQGIPVIKRNGLFTAENSFPGAEGDTAGGCTETTSNPENPAHTCVRWEMTVQTADEFWKQIENDAGETDGTKRAEEVLFDGYNRVEALCMPMGMACGPWIGHYTGYAPLVKVMKQNAFLHGIYYVVVVEPIIAWLVAFVIFCLYMFKSNSNTVIRQVSEEKEVHWQNAIAMLQKQVKKQARQIAMQKKAAKLD